MPDMRSEKRVDPARVITPTDELLQAIERDPLFPYRSKYASDVLYGRQNLSGSDLKGSAGKWGAAYAKKRAAVRNVAAMHGVQVVALKPSGRLVWTNGLLPPSEVVEEVKN